MYYKLNENIGLRSYQDIKTAYFYRGGREVYSIAPEGFELLAQCDGETPLAPNPMLAMLSLEGLIEPLQAPRAISSWQRLKKCDNPCFPALNWAITQRCNYSCRHCFMASGSGIESKEFSWAECMRLMEDIVECGIWRVSLTGGEPLVHPHFLDIVRELTARHIDIFEIATNGALITGDILKAFIELGQRPLFKISFDGIGYHDIMRGSAGAEADAINAIRLCRDMGFPVRVQMNINKENASVIPKSLDFVESLGVEQTRVIRTSEAPRWQSTAPGQSLDHNEYFDESLRLIAKYIKNEHTMRLTLWQFAELDPAIKAYHNRPVKFCRRIDDLSLPACPMNRLMLSVTGAGELLPCNQMEGYYKMTGQSIANVHKTRLQALLNDPECLKTLLLSVGDIFKSDKCGACEYRTLCGGGCQALSLAENGDMLKCDSLKCTFFKDGYFERLAKLFSSALWHTSDEL